MMDRVEGVFGTLWTGLKFLIGCFLLLAPLILILFGDGEHERTYGTLESKGIETQATITRLIRSEGVRTRRQSALGLHNWQYHVTYEFKTKNGKLFKKDARLEQEQFEELKQGQKISVLYHPDQPIVQRLTDYQKPYSPIPMSAKLGSLVLFGGLGLWLVWGNGARLMAAWQGSGGSGGGRGVPIDLDRMVATRTSGGARPRRQGGGFGQRGRA